MQTRWQAMQWSMHSRSSLWLRIASAFAMVGFLSGRRPSGLTVGTRGAATIPPRADGWPTAPD
ncbi:hypothetical protein ASNO1_09390 [Corallococcus caeni]|uniref:Uncharacterized protein n=1 Tax=Corallococcus caeni TaxID=3082388 RepID=A0ABQ6QLI8_9BACT|nr:hypothetical protein ASNO1_09390 [Corallococcus sp. NO1]